MAAIAKGKASGAKRERSGMRKVRISNSRRARETTKRVVIPAMLAVMAAIVVVFFYKYGFGGVRTVVK